MNHKSSENGFDAHINALHRLKDIYVTTGFPTLNGADLNEQYKLAVEALAEEKKFLRYLESDAWPDRMQTIRHNLLRTTTLDDEIKLNRGNDLTILVSLRSTMLRIDPVLVDRQDQRLQEKQKSASSQDQTEQDDQQQQDLENKDDSHQTSETTPSYTAEDIEKMNLEEDRCRLKSKGIECFNMQWEQYLKSEHKETDKKVDLLISQPPSAPSRSIIHSIRNRVKNKEEISQEEVKLLPKSLKRILKPGGYVIMMIPFFSFMEWYDAFYSEGYEIFEEPYVLSYNTNTIQTRHPPNFPQKTHETVLIARLHTSKEQSFSPDFDSDFSLVQCSNSRNSSVMSNISKPKSLLYKKGTKIPFHPNELSPFMLSELIDLFTPQCGTVLDLYAGTMTTAIAAMC